MSLNRPNLAGNRDSSERAISARERGSVSLDTVDKLVEYLGLELVPKLRPAKKRKTRKDAQGSSFTQPNATS